MAISLSIYFDRRRAGVYFRVERKKWREVQREEREMKRNRKVKENYGIQKDTEMSIYLDL